MGWKPGADTLVLVRGFGPDALIAHHLRTENHRSTIRIWVAEARTFQPGALDVAPDRLTPFRCGPHHPARTALDAFMVVENRIRDNARRVLGVC